jgi:hypothetical protein
MKKITYAFALAIIILSCKKTSSPANPSSPSSGTLLTSVWILDSTNANLVIDSFLYDNYGNVAKFIRLDYSTSAMAIPLHPLPDTYGSMTWTFSYLDTINKSPASYKVIQTFAPNAGILESHLLVYDNQNRITADSTLGVQGNDTFGYTPTTNNVRTAHYSYNGNTMISASYLDDVSVLIDSLHFVNGNLTDWSDWQYSTPDLNPASGLFRIRLQSGTYSDIDNPLYKYKISSIFSISQNMYVSEDQGQSAKLGISGSWSTPFQPSNGSGTVIYTWQTDSKGQAARGLGGTGADATKYLFHYK